MDVFQKKEKCRCLGVGYVPPHPCFGCKCINNTCTFKGDKFYIDAKKTKNAFLCENIENQNCKDICYFELALETENISLCEKIINEGNKNTCLEQLENQNKTTPQIQKYKADPKYCQKNQDCGCSTCGCLNFYWKDKMDCETTFEGAICDKVGCICKDNHCVLAEVKPGVIPSLQGVFYQIPSDPTVVVYGFRTCGGYEFAIDPKIYRSLNISDFEGKGTFEIINPAISRGKVKLHGYEQMFVEMYIITSFEKINKISESECIQEL